ncbi:MAG TPA: TfoX/Sxy family protein [Anaeromyxobacteraceae bacterium]|nr:TfoX/Sxy family protein [Anaeromyxobacteraceae bacterium]
MAYDLELAARVREMLGGRSEVTERAMFGGLAFLLKGKMFCGVLGNELLARVGPEAHDAAMAQPHVRIMDFTGRPMRGYVFVGPAAIPTTLQLKRWVKDCEAHAATLPDKPPKKRATAPRRADRARRGPGPPRRPKAAGRR